MEPLSLNCVKIDIEGRSIRLRRKPLSSLTIRADPPSIAGQTRKFAATVKMCVRQPKRDSQ